MSLPVTHPELDAKIGPVRGKLDLVAQRVEHLEGAHDKHLTDAAADRAELREMRDWMIRSEAAAQANGRWLKFLTGGSLLGFLGILGLLAEMLRRLN